MKTDNRDVPKLAPQDDRWLPTEQAAEYLGVKVDTLSKWRLRGIGPQYSATLKRDPRYRLSDLMAHMSANMASNTREAKTLRKQLGPLSRGPVTLRRAVRPHRSGA